MIDKGLVRSRFGRARESYDHVAHFQRKMGAELIKLYDAPGTAEKVLELGCGTGLFSERLLERCPSGSLFHFNDLSPDVLHILEEKIGGKHVFISGDAEVLTWGNGYTLVASNASIQWWKDPLSFLSKARESLDCHHGQVLLGTFLPDNFHELGTVTGLSLSYPSEMDILQRLEEEGFCLSGSRSIMETVLFPGILSLLRHLKGTGTNAIPNGSRGLWTPSRLQRLEQDYRDSSCLSPSDPLPLTYSGLLLSARLL